MEINDFKENHGNGWIKLYRSIKNHWLFPKNKPLTNFEAWIVIMLEVNHSGNKVQIGYDVFECKRGESLNSLETWAKLFHWHKSKVRRFFNLLQKDSMIVLNSNQKTTHLTICNYELYQGDRNTSETQVKRKRNASETQVTPNKNEKNEKNEKNIPEFSEFKNYALEKKPKVDLIDLKLKYEAWKVNGWKNGNNKPIKNWKSAILNTLPFIKENSELSSNAYPASKKLIK